VDGANIAARRCVSNNKREFSLRQDEGLPVMPAYFPFSPRTLELAEAGKLEEALEVSLELLASARHRGIDQEVVLQHLNEVSELSFRLEIFSQAIDARQEMLARQEVLAENQVSEGVVAAVSQLSWYYAYGGQFGPAKQYLERGLELVQQLPDVQRREFPGLYITSCYLAWDQGNLPEAMAHLMTAWKMHSRYTRDCGNGLFTLYRFYGQLLQEMGEWNRAAKSCRIALQTFDAPDLSKNAYYWLSQLHYLRGILLRHDQERDAALAAFQHALNLLKEAPRQYPLRQQRAAEKYSAAIANVLAQNVDLDL
jgi:tetratricopeptide (TPR) repeat protein